MFINKFKMAKSFVQNNYLKSNKNFEYITKLF
jgi:hypothetical protein